MNEESEFVAHEPCSNCGSSDANSVYSDGHKFCFSCNTYTPAEDWTHTHTRMTNDNKTKAQFLGAAEALRKEESAKQQTTSTEFIDMVTPYVSHTTEMMVSLLASNQTKSKTSITKEDLQIRFLVNTYFQLLVSELLSLKEN